MERPSPAMLYALARLCQLIGLILVPVAIAGNLVEIAGAAHRLDLKQSLALSGLGIAVFYLGWWMQQQAGRK